MYVVLDILARLVLYGQMKKHSVEHYAYDLPQELIAQHPREPRTSSRLLRLRRAEGVCSHHVFSNLLDFLTPLDLLVFNDTKVFPARLFGQKESGGKLECLIERIVGDRAALAHLRASKSPSVGSVILLGAGLRAEVVSRVGELFELRFDIEQPLIDLLWAQGQMPLPPYITRSPDKLDAERYQTVFADRVGAVAAPTAGLHFDERLIAEIEAKGVTTAKLTLHVGAGTFQPVRVDDLTKHHMHSEWIEVTQSVCDAVTACRCRGGRVIAVGTTVLRALESASVNGALSAYQGETDIFIYPGFEFHCVDGLLTNFHLPKSTLLMLVAAFAGFDSVLNAYQQAIEQRYRFFSYGDCMLID